MKKVLSILIIVFISVIASVYIFIPTRLTVSKVTFMHANENALLRYLSTEDKWQRWWPGKENLSGQKQLFKYNGFTYRLTKVLYHEVDVDISNASNSYSGRIMLIPVNQDSLAIKWETALKTSANPIDRFLSYQQARRIHDNMKVILDSLKEFGELKEGLYAYHIRRTTIQDTTLVSAKMVTTRYPSIKDIYGVVDDLKKYIADNGAKETNFPMLHVTTTDSVHYTTMIAIPTNKELPGTQKITAKRMIIYNDKTIIAEVTGGPASIKNAYRELDVFMQDYNLTNPVIHWESLVTDRSKQTDSAKWITKIFMPVV